MCDEELDHRHAAVLTVSLAVCQRESCGAQRRADGHHTTVHRRRWSSRAEDTGVAWRPASCAPSSAKSEAVKVSAARSSCAVRGFVWACPASKRQYAIIVSGRGEVDVVGGEEFSSRLGVLLAEDVTGKGHRARRRRRIS